MSFISIPLAIAMHVTPATKLKESSILLTSCRGYVQKNIKKRMELITQAWETQKSIASFETRAHALQEHL